MNILVVGATGSVGRHLVKQSVAAGHSVTALCRNPAESGFERAEQLTIAAGNPMEPTSLGAAVEGQDAVLLTLGGGLADHVRSKGTQNTIEAMARAGVERLICQTTLGVGDSRPLLNVKWKILFGTLLRLVYNDHERQEAAVRGSDLRWTLVRPAAFTDGPQTGEYRHGFGVDASALSLDISRADIAHFMLQQLESDANIGKACGLSY